MSPAAVAMLKAKNGATTPMDDYRLVARPARQTLRAHPDHLLWKWLDTVGITTAEFAEKADMTRAGVSLWTNPENRVPESVFPLLKELSGDNVEALAIIAKLEECPSCEEKPEKKTKKVKAAEAVAAAQAAQGDGTLRLPREVLDKIEALRLTKEKETGKSWSKVMTLRWVLLQLDQIGLLTAGAK